MNKVKIIVLGIIILWWLFFYNNISYNNKNNIVKNIEKSLVIIIPEKILVSFEENPGWVLGYDEESWIWMGFFINNNWEILTVNHVIKNKNINYLIKTNDNKEYKALVISRDEKNDLAILKIDTEKKYTAIKVWNDNSKIKIWDDIISFWVNINNLKNTYTYWKISNINKKLDNIQNLIEFYPVIKPGFSGWPIINKNWEVIWINYSVYKNKSYGIKLPLKFLQ